MTAPDTQLIHDLRRTALAESHQLRAELPAMDPDPAPEVTAGGVTFPVSCPQCGRSLSPVTSDDPKGWAVRERRLVVRCTKRGCRWTGVVVVELIDLTHKRSVA